MKAYKSVLLLKLPYCPHPEAISTINIKENYRTRVPFRPFPSLALAVLCGFLEKHKSIDYALKAVDINIEAYQDPLTAIDISVYSKLLEDCIENASYEVIALSATFVSDFRWVDTAVGFSRQYHPNAKIILGGGYPTIFPERAITKHDMDDVIVGEGEHTLLHLLNRYNNHHDESFEKRFPFEGYISRNGNGGFTQNIEKTFFLAPEDIPEAVWDYLNVDKYFRSSGDNRLPIEASRGCPYHCTYCCGHMTWGRKTRHKPLENLIEEIKQIKKNYPDIGVHFIDDNMNSNRKWMKAFLNQMIKDDLGIKIYVSNFNVKQLDEDIIDHMDRAGIRQLGIAIETASPEIQKFIKKNLKIDRIREIIKILNKKNFHIHMCWMIGFPNETMAQINKTLELVREFRGNTNSFSIVLPYPGTQMFEDTKALGALAFPDNYLDKFDNRNCDHVISDEWDYEKLQQMIYDINIEINFLNNRALDTAEGTEYFHDYLKTFLKRMPDHIIAHIIVGYIHKQKGDSSDCEKHYDAAIQYLEDKTLSETFSKYLSWSQHSIKDFNLYMNQKGFVLSPQIAQKKIASS